DQHRARDGRGSHVAPRAVCARKCRPVDGAEFEDRAVGLLPNFLAVPCARLAPYGMMILITLLLFLPMLGLQMGVDLNIISHLLLTPTEIILRAILRLTGNG